MLLLPPESSMISERKEKTIIVEVGVITGSRLHVAD